MKKKKGLITFARAVLYLVTAGGIGVFFVLLPELAREEGARKPFDPFMLVLFFANVYLVATPFFLALFQSHKLLNYFGKNKAFSNQSVRVLRNIKLCAIAMSLLIAVSFIAWVSFARMTNPNEDMPPFILIGSVLTFAAAVIAVAAAVMQRLIADAVEVKSENDLIV